MKKFLTTLIALALLLTATVGLCDDDEFSSFECPLTGGTYNDTFTVDKIMASNVSRAVLSICLIVDFNNHKNRQYDNDDLLAFLFHSSYVSRKGDVIFVTGYIDEEMITFSFSPDQKEAYYYMFECSDGFSDDTMDCIMKESVKKQDIYYKNDPDTIKAILKKVAKLR